MGASFFFEESGEGPEAPLAPEAPAVFDWRSLARLREPRALRDVDFDMVRVVVV